VAIGGKGTGARPDAVCQVPAKSGEGGGYGSRSLVAAPKFDPRSQPRDCPGCKKQAMFPAAPPGTGGAELSASRPGALKNSGPMDASSHEYLNGYGI
jgi:hypothetical protein